MTSGFYEYMQSAFARGQFMAFLQSFFDESGKFNDHKVVAFCGFCSSSSSKLKEFDEDWKYQLRRVGTTALHIKTACRINKRLGSNIGPQTLRARINELKPFVDCIHNHLELGIACVFEVSGYAAFTVNSKKLIGGSDNPFYLQFLRTMLLLVDYVKPDGAIGIMCDEDEETAWNCYQFYRRVKKVEPNARRSLVALTFANDKHFPALQAADMLSFLCRLHAHYNFYGTEYDFHPLFRYLYKERGTSAIQWRVAFRNKQTLKPLGKNLNRTATKKKEGGQSSKCRKIQARPKGLTE